MKEVIVRASCDRHYPDSCPGGDVRDVVVWGRTIDLCDDHRAELVDPLRELVDAVGVRPDPPSTGVPPRAAGGGQKPSKNLHVAPCLCGKAGAHDAHIRSAHKMSTGDLFGTRCPLCGETFQTASVLGSHASRIHELRGSAHVFAQAERAGDPFGIVAERRQLVNGPRARAKGA